MTGEAQALRWHGVSTGGGGLTKFNMTNDSNKPRFTSSEEDEDDYFAANLSQRAVKIVRTAKDKVLPQ